MSCFITGQPVHRARRLHVINAWLYAIVVAAIRDCARGAVAIVA